MINEAYVSFETAKLLKEKGFNECCKQYYNKRGHFYNAPNCSNFNHPNYQETEEDDTLTSAPTQQMVIRWLREEFNIYVNLHTDYHGTQWTIMEKTLSVGKGGFGITYEDACEVAIKYCLANLI